MPVRVVDETFEGDAAGHAREVLASLNAAPPPPVQQDGPVPPQPKPPTKEALMEYMAMIARIMGFRIQLFFGFLGAAGIGSYAVYQANTMALVAAGMFDVLIFLPLVILAFKRG